VARYFPELPLGDVVDVHEVAGQGVEARYLDRRVRLGRPDWVAEITSQRTADANAPGSAFAIEGSSLYRSHLAETLRPDGGWMVSTLQGQGISCRIISGDHEAPVMRVAKSLGMDGFQAAMRPGNKLDYLNREATAQHKVLMVGDGLNDAPALVAAHVSMAPSSASDVGRTAADFVFTRSSLSAVVYAYDVAIATHRIVKQNFGLAILYNALAVPLAVSGQLNPLLAAIAMSTSSIIVVGNSLRLHLLKPRSPEASVISEGSQSSTAIMERYA
jgi:P-type Cu2+ transporter